MVISYALTAIIIILNYILLTRGIMVGENGRGKKRSKRKKKSFPKII